MDERAKYSLVLCKAAGIGVVNFKRLVDYFKTPNAAWHAPTETLLQVCGLDRLVIDKFIQYRQSIDVEVEWDRFLQSQIKMVTIDDELYPSILRHIHNPPPVLFYRGFLKKCEPLVIAIVGSRRCTTYGRHMAEQLASELAEHGFTVVSGLARGIDTAAHRGALKAGRTIAVLGSGVDIVYPPENKALYQDISLTGAIISEYPPGTPPLAGHFPARNRLISGLATGVVVVEAAEKSGALITVDFALEQGRDVYAVPGCITNPSSKGPHKLIQQGAKLVACVEDILEDYGVKINKPPKSGDLSIELTLAEQELLNQMAMTPTGIEVIMSKSSKDAGLIHSMLLNLEIKGLIETLPGKRYKLAEVKGFWR